MNKSQRSDTERAKTMTKATHTKPVKHTCPKCDGAGVIDAFSHIENGKCFWCGGTGHLTHIPEDEINRAMCMARKYWDDCQNEWEHNPSLVTECWAGRVAEELHKVGTDKAREFLTYALEGRYSTERGYMVTAPRPQTEAIYAAVLAAGRAQKKE